MAASILFALGLNAQTLPSLIYLEENVGADASFLISSILSQRTKTITTHKTKIMLCCFHQTFEHYHNAGVRLGYSLNTYKQTNQVLTYEPMHDLYQRCLLNNEESKLLSEFETMILNEIDGLKDEKLILIIDDLTFYCNLGFTEQELLKFTIFLKQLKLNSNVTTILKTNTSDLYPILTHFLEDLSDLIIKIEKLKSGNFQEVDGKLSLIKPQAIMEGREVSKVVLYKVTDKAVKIFAPGEVGVKM